MADPFTVIPPVAVMSKTPVDLTLNAADLLSALFVNLRISDVSLTPATYKLRSFIRYLFASNDI